MKKLAIDINDLVFTHPGQAEACIKGLSLQIPENKSFGLFGSNGAGKTTLMQLMTGLLNYNQGSIRIFGKEVSENRNAIKKLFGFVPQEYSFFQELTPVQNLEYFGAMCGMTKTLVKSRINYLLEVMDLIAVKDKQVHKFSGGMKRRVNLAIGVIHNPSLLFLDEPTVGVDIQTRRAIISYLRTLNENGTTLVYTSHQLSEAQELCDQVALIESGKILVCDSLNSLLSEHQQDGFEELYLSLTGKTYSHLDNV